MTEWDLDAMNARLVRYRDLRPCTTAFIDARTPGSDAKENFTIIGPGVAENPDQHVHIREPHGFNIGGARQPPGCTNSQHSHETAEVFVVHSGRWAFRTGVDASDGEVVLDPGDVISLPTRSFRGFENVGTETGFLFAVLGGDDPGRVTWAPRVFEMAKEYGLVLLEDGRLVDTTRGQTVPADARPMPVTSPAQIAALRTLTSADLERCVVRAGWAPVAEGGLSDQAAGISEVPIIGGPVPEEGLRAGPLAWSHGFQLRRLSMAAGAATGEHRRAEEEVLFVHQGALAVTWPGGTLALGAGDVLTVPKDLARRFANPGPDPARIFVVRGTDHPQAAARAA